MGKNERGGVAPGAIIHHEYECHLPNGTDAVFAVSLHRLSDASTAAAFARENGAVAHGTVTVSGMPGAPSTPAAWMCTRAGLAIAVTERDPAMGDDVLSALVRVFRTFFRDIRELAPGLADFHLRIRTMR
jgi:hypothetical protein